MLALLCGPGRVAAQMKDSGLVCEGERFWLRARTYRHQDDDDDFTIYKASLVRDCGHLRVPRELKRPRGRPLGEDSRAATTRRSREQGVVTV